MLFSLVNSRTAKGIEPSSSIDVRRIAYCTPVPWFLNTISRLRVRREPKIFHPWNGAFVQFQFDTRTLLSETIRGPTTFCAEPLLSSGIPADVPVFHRGSWHDYLISSVFGVWHDFPSAKLPISEGQHLLDNWIFLTFPCFQF
jgi:hypothetical protein